LAARRRDDEYSLYLEERLVRALQRARVLLAPERHAVHHRGGRAYAVVCGWSNAWLDVALPRLERVLTALGARPGQR
jgi:hypothetical protein